MLFPIFLCCFYINFLLRRSGLRFGYDLRSRKRDSCLLYRHKCGRLSAYQSQCGCPLRYRYQFSGLGQHKGGRFSRRLYFSYAVELATYIRWKFCADLVERCYDLRICECKHLYKVESLPVNEYLKDDGVKLVNAYASLNDKIKGHKIKIDEVSEELDKVKEAVIQYAQKEDIEVIKGSGHKLKISEKQKVSSPAKGRPERKELEDALREANKWEEVSDLDPYSLEKAVNEERWDKKIINKIKGFLKLETKKSVSLSKLHEEEK